MVRAAIVLLGVLFAAVGAARAQDERTRTDPTGWFWFYGQSPESISSFVASTGTRVVDFEVESASPLRLSVALVANEGAYAKAWWHFYGLTSEQLTKTLENLQARPIDVEPYDDNGTTRFAAVLVPNTGPDTKHWWFYHDTTAAAIGEAAGKNGARIVDLDRYVAGGKEQYSAILIENGGRDQSAWWWFVGIDAGALSDKVTHLNARFLSFESYDVKGKRYYDAVLIPALGKKSWFHTGISSDRLGELIAQYGARVIQIASYAASGQTVFDVALVNNSNAATTRIANILQYGTDGETGLYLKEVGGSVLASLNENRAFEPASAIKALCHFHAVRAVQNSRARLAEPLAWCSVSSDPASPKDGCPNTPCGEILTLENALSQMMMISDNRATDAVMRRFGRAEMNVTAAELGMTSSALRHTIGCSTSAVLNPNQLTLADLGLLYESVATGALDEEHRELFYSLMLHGISLELSNIIAGEGAALGMTGAQVDHFQQKVRLAAKAGSYTLWSSTRQAWEHHWSQGLWARLPVCSNGAEVAREYVTGAFVAKGLDRDGVNGRGSTAATELLREPIRGAMSSFAGSCEPPPPPSTPFRRGDANLDRKLDLSDAVHILSYLFTGKQELRCEDAADVNDDGAIDVSDPSALLHFLFLGGKLPGGVAGKLQEDATEDKLDCDFYPEG